MKTTFKKVMPLHYIVSFNSMWYELYIDLDYNGKFSCFFFNKYFEANSENEIKKLVKNLLIENSKH
jgi:hypothetical protein